MGLRVSFFNWKFRYLSVSWLLNVFCVVSFVSSEEEAKQKIYNVSCERYFGFGCEIDEETSNKLEGLFRC